MITDAADACVAVGEEALRLHQEGSGETHSRLFWCRELNESAEEERPSGRTADGWREERGEESAELNHLQSSEALFRQPGDVTVCVWLAAGQLRPRSATEKALRNPAAAPR